ncbi:MAG: response regulator transcription factor [Ruminococcus bromii]|nr:response regulator transcription factor [Ruminococcus bromii]MDD6329989.1 response regulator transcription factor [Bacillota bacterium]MDD7646884.1 response regulator transcription factor [Ruminococcus bromii]
MIRILIVEDDENISKMLAATLSIGGYTYEQCADGVEAAARIPEGAYDLVLLDVMLPGLDGFAVLDTIRAAGCDTPVIFLTALGAVADKVKGLRGGAEDYIVKPFEAVELLARIEVVLRRAGKSEMHLSYGDIRVDIEKHTVLKGGQPVTLTPKEFDVLVFFMRNPDVAITREQLLSNIWGYNFAGESRSVDIHVQQVRRKLGLRGKLITIPKLGYRLERLR